MMLGFSSFVFSASSVDTAGFSVNAPEKAVASYTPAGVSLSGYLGYAILIVLVLVAVYSVVNMKKGSGKNVSSKDKIKKK